MLALTTGSGNAGMEASDQASDSAGTVLKRSRLCAEAAEGPVSDAIAASGCEVNGLLLATASIGRHPTKCRVGHSPTAVPRAVLKPASVFQML
jgi:hypothetical protein